MPDEDDGAATATQAPRATPDLPSGAPTLEARVLDQLFRGARTHNKWQDRPVADATLQELYDLLKWGPTSANSMPARFVFLRTPEAKARLIPALTPGNVDKTKQAPVTVIIGSDTRFYELMPTKLFTHRPEMAENFAKNPSLAQITAFRNGTLQGAYFILAARALGLDTGPMSGYDQAGVDKEFFPGGKVKSNFLCSIGYGDASGVMGRLPRLAFDEMAQIL
jgi:3-hydroxypropanoate dehydrogenase